MHNSGSGFQGHYRGCGCGSKNSPNCASKTGTSDSDGVNYGVERCPEHHMGTGRNGRVSIYRTWNINWMALCNQYIHRGGQEASLSVPCALRYKLHFPPLTTFDKLRVTYYPFPDLAIPRSRPPRVFSGL